MHPADRLAVLLRDLPLVEPDRLAWMYNARTERDRAPFSIADLEDYRSGNATLAGLAAFTNWTANQTGNGEAERLEGPAHDRRLLPAAVDDRQAALLPHGGRHLGEVRRRVGVVVPARRVQVEAVITYEEEPA